MYCRLVADISLFVGNCVCFRVILEVFLGTSVLFCIRIVFVCAKEGVKNDW